MAVSRVRERWRLRSALILKHKRYLRALNADSLKHGKRVYFSQLQHKAGSLIIGSPIEPPLSHRRWLIVVRVVRKP
jgi:hypothetical protein